MMSRRARVLLVALAATAVAIVLAVMFLYGPVGAWVLRTKVLPKLEARLGMEVAAGDIEVERGRAFMRAVSVGAQVGNAPLVTIEEIEVSFDVASSLAGRPDIHDVWLRGVAIDLDKDDPRLETLRAARKGDGKGESTGGSSIRPRRVFVESGTLRARDAATASTIEATLAAVWAPERPMTLTLGDVVVESSLAPPTRAKQVVVEVDPRAPQTASATITSGRIRFTPEGQRTGGDSVGAVKWPDISLTGIDGRVSRAEDGAITIDLGGTYGENTERLWSARGRFLPSAHTGSLDIVAEKFELGRVAHLLEGSGVIDPQPTTIGVDVHIEATASGIRFTGKGALVALSFFNPHVAEKPIRNLSLSADIAGDVDLGARKVTLERADLTLGEVVYHLEGSAQAGDPAAPEGDPRRQPRLSAHLVIPEVPCQTMLASIPPDFAPYLQGFELGGRFHTDVTLSIDWADLGATVLDGEVGIRGCKVVSAPEDVGADRLKEPFEHWVEVEGGQWVAFEVGPDNPDYVPLADISPHIVNSIMTTEDSRFYRHRGFIPSEFKSALVKDLEAGYFKYGASSITMQMVKNVILYREKTMARKFQELFFTWYLETELDKDRIMEIYLNVIEYGPGLYGIGPATREYFDKHPRDLGPVEAAFFSSILPNPKKRYAQFCDGELTAWTQGKIQRILQLMNKRDRLGDQEYMLAAVTPLEFAIRDHISPKECKERVKKFLEQKGAKEANPRKR